MQLEEKNAIKTRLLGSVEVLEDCIFSHVVQAISKISRYEMYDSKWSAIILICRPELMPVLFRHMEHFLLSPSEVQLRYFTLFYHIMETLSKQMLPSKRTYFINVNLFHKLACPGDVKSNSGIREGSTVETL